MALGRGREHGAAASSLQGVRSSPFTVHRSPFTVHRSPFTVHRFHRRRSAAIDPGETTRKIYGYSEVLSIQNLAFSFRVIPLER
jgi:hypothetical protein